METQTSADAAISKLLSIRKANKEDLARLNFCAYQALEVNPYGKELMDGLSMRLKAIIGLKSSISEYADIVSKNDFIRVLLGMIEQHKIDISGGKS